MLFHPNTQYVLIDPRSPILVSPIFPQEPVEDEVSPHSCGPLFPEDPSGGGEVRPLQSQTSLPLLLLVDELQPLFPSAHCPEAPGGGACDSGPCEPGGGALGGDGVAALVMPEEPGGKGSRVQPVFFLTSPAGNEDERSFND